MAVYDIYSKRQLALELSASDVYQYDDFPSAFREQVIQIFDEFEHDVYRKDRVPSFLFLYEVIVKILRREYGVTTLVRRTSNYDDELDSFLRDTVESAKVLDVVELICKYMEHYGYSRAIDEINHRFKEHSIGFEYTNRTMVKISSEFVHSEITKPALGLLDEDEDYSTVRSEYITSYDHYRVGRHKDAITSCGRALESMLKVLCDRHRWRYKTSDVGGDLLAICARSGLLEPATKAEIKALVSGVLAIRNILGAHGDAPDAGTVSEHTVKYMLDITAATLILLDKYSRACDV